MPVPAPLTPQKEAEKATACDHTDSLVANLNLIQAMKSMADDIVAVIDAKM